jgi:hypothetical protein
MPRTIAHDKRSKSKKQADFLEKFSACASVSKAATQSKVPRRTVYEWFKADKAFKIKYDEASVEVLGVLEDEAVRRAYEGVNRPVWQGGKKMGTVKDYSDVLLIMLLKARAPEKYKERFAGELSGPGGKPIQTERIINASLKLS